jgi:hypothetical protein
MERAVVQREKAEDRAADGLLRRAGDGRPGEGEVSGREAGGSGVPDEG